MTGLRLREEGLGRERLATEHLGVPGSLEERSRHGFIWMWNWSSTGFTAEKSGLREMESLALGHTAGRWQSCS